MPLTHPIIPNALYFITQVTFNRAPLFANLEVTQLFLQCLRSTQTLHPFRMRGYVILPDHFHLLIAPDEGARIDVIMRSCKAVFTREYKRSRGLRGNVTIWQTGFMDHVIRDEYDFERHLNYMHYNPVKHGLVQHPEDWAHSSFRTWKERGHYADGWGWSLEESDTVLDWRPSD